MDTIKWNFNPHSTPSLSQIQHPVGLKLPDRRGNIHQLKQHSPKVAVRILSVHIAMDGNMEKEYSILKEKADKYKHILYRCKFTTAEAKTIYQQCYLPALMYPLLATSMDPKKIQAMQDQVMVLLLRNMGCSHLFPCSATFTPATLGGLRLQDIQKATLLLKHGHAKTHHWPALQILLYTCQLYAGINKLILKDTSTLQWCPPEWVTSLQRFLHQINSKIILDQLGNPSSIDREIDPLRMMPETSH